MTGDEIMSVEWRKRAAERRKQQEAEQEDRLTEPNVWDGRLNLAFLLDDLNDAKLPVTVELAIIRAALYVGDAIRELTKALKEGRG